MYEEVHLVQALAKPLLHHLLEDAAVVVIGIIKSLFCPMEEAFVLLVRT